MRILKAYQGKYIAYRAWFDGKLIWNYGDDTMGDLVAALNAVAKPEPEVPDAILLQGEAITEGTGLAAVWELEPVLTRARMGMNNNVRPRAAEAVHALCETTCVTKATARPYTYGTVFTRGHTAAELITNALPHHADTVHAVGVADFGDIDVAPRPRPEEVIKILAAADATIDTPALPVPQEPERVEMKVAHTISGSAGVSALQVHTVTFMVDGEVKHEERVIHGYACPDPVETGAIDKPTKEMTVSHVYEQSGWEAEVTETTLAALLETEDLSGFVQHPDFGMYFTGFPKSFSLVVGESYTVSWDGQEYDVIAQDASALNGGAEMIAVGNGAAFGMSGNNEPFIIATTADVMMFFVADPSDSSDTHNVGIYQELVVEGVDSDPLSCITQDIVVYPTFTESIRYYTVRFWDGDTLVDTVSVPYGGTAVTSYTKPGYKATWEPSGENITGDTDCYGRFDEVTLANSTWAEIAEISEAGLAKNFFKIGDSKTVPVTISGTTHQFTAKIVGFDHDDLADGSGKAGITFLMFTVPETKYQYHTSNLNSNLQRGYDTCYISMSAVPAVANGFPAELRAVYKSVKKEWNKTGSATKYTGNYSRWVPSVAEVNPNAINSSYNAKLGSLYEYFSNAGSAYGNTSMKTKVLTTGGKTASSFWMRDCIPTSYNYYAIYTTGDTVSRGNTTNTNYIPIGFCV